MSSPHSSVTREAFELTDVDGYSLSIVFEGRGSSAQLVIQEDGATSERHLLRTTHLEVDEHTHTLYFQSGGRLVFKFQVAEGSEAVLSRVVSLWSRKRGPTSALGRLGSKRAHGGGEARPGSKETVNRSGSKSSLARTDSIGSAARSLSKMSTDKGDEDDSPVSNVASRAGSKESARGRFSHVGKEVVGGLIGGARLMPSAVTPDDKQKLHGLFAGRHVSTGPPCLASLAHKWGLPLDCIIDSSEVFQKYATLEGVENLGHVLRDGFLDPSAMEAVVCLLTGVQDISELSQDMRDAMYAADKDDDGRFDFEEFATWYHRRQFMECISVPKGEMELRSLGYRFGLNAGEMDHMKVMFDKFDTDRSGQIDPDEFRHLLGVLLKCPAGMEIPENRVEHLWKDCDADQSGLVDLEEFIAFYIKYFDKDAENPLEDFYHGIDHSRQRCRDDFA